MNKKLIFLTTINFIIFLFSLYIFYTKLIDETTNTNKRENKEMVYSNLVNINSNNTKFDNLKWRVYSNPEFNITFEYPENYTNNLKDSLKEENNLIRISSESGMNYIFEVKKLDLNSATKEIEDYKSIGNIYKTKFRGMDAYYVDITANMQVPSNTYFILVDKDTVIAINYAKNYPASMLSTMKQDTDSINNFIKWSNEFDTNQSLIINRILNSISFIK